MSAAAAAVGRGLVLLVFKAAGAGLGAAGIGAALFVLAALLALTRGAAEARVRSPKLDLIVLLLTLVLPFLVRDHPEGVGLADQPVQQSRPDHAADWSGRASRCWRCSSSSAVVIGWFWLRQRWLIAAGMLSGRIELLFFTTFLTNGQGIGTGLIGSLGYWIDQQEVMRGGQPWYYFYRAGAAVRVLAAGVDHRRVSCIAVRDAAGSHADAPDRASRRRRAQRTAA